MPNARRLSLRSFVLALPCILVALDGCSSVTNDHEDLGQTEEALCDGTIKGDWADFPAGDGKSSVYQCVHGVSLFYTAKFGVPRIAASYAKNTGNCEGYGACNLWITAANHPTASLWNRYDWGKETPQTYDLVIYPPATAALGYGHVASVDHVSGGVIYVMDMNWNSAPDSFRYRKATCAHTIARTPYGFYRLKSLEPATPKPPVDAGVDTGVDAHDAEGSETDADAKADGETDGASTESDARELDARDPDADEAGLDGGDMQGGSCSTSRVRDFGEPRTAIAMAFILLGGWIARRRTAHRDRRSASIRG